MIFRILLLHLLLLNLLQEVTPGKPAGFCFRDAKPGEKRVPDFVGLSMMCYKIRRVRR